MVDVPRAIESVRSIEAHSAAGCTADGRFLFEHLFQWTLVRERKRTERSGKPFLLMLVDVGACSSMVKRHTIFSSIISALSCATRETDVIGWYKNDCVVGIMFTEITAQNKPPLPGVMLARMSEVLQKQLGVE